MTRQLVLPQPVRLFRPVRPGSTNLRFQDELAGTAEILKVADDLVVVGWDHNANLAFKVEGPKEGYILAESVDDAAWKPTADWMNAYKASDEPACAKYLEAVKSAINRHLKPDLKVVS